MIELKTLLANEKTVEAELIRVEAEIVRKEKERKEKEDARIKYINAISLKDGEKIVRYEKISDFIDSLNDDEIEDIAHSFQKSDETFYNLFNQERDVFSPFHFLPNALACRITCRLRWQRDTEQATRCFFIADDRINEFYQINARNFSNHISASRERKAEAARLKAIADKAEADENRLVEKIALRVAQLLKESP